jgi:hypothetical protein
MSRWVHLDDRPFAAPHGVPACGHPAMTWMPAQTRIDADAVPAG